MYKNSQDGNSIIRIKDGAVIPKDSENLDYQTVLKFQRAGGEIQDADPVPEQQEKSILDDLSTSQVVEHLISAIKDAVNNKNGLVDLKLSDVEAKATEALPTKNVQITEGK